MWVHEIQANSGCESNTPGVRDTALHRMALHERTLHLPHRSSVGELWWPRDKRLRKVVKQLRGLPGRYGERLHAGADLGKGGRKRRLFAGKLQVGNDVGTGPKQKNQQANRHALGADYCFGGVREIRNRKNDAVVSDRQRVPGKYVVCEAGCEKQVYDILNAGPKHCFTVMSDCGPMLVHNCVQAIARDVLAESLERLETAGFPVVFHVHDEVVIDMPPFAEDKDMLKCVTDIMTRPLPWAPDLPLGADGWVGDFFTKD